jgi:hypothetical protein
MHEERRRLDKLKESSPEAMKRYQNFLKMLEAEGKAYHRDKEANP